MANVNLPPPPPLQFIQADGKTVAWNWQDWFFQLQAKAANVNSTLSSIVVPPEFSVAGNNTPTATITKVAQAANSVWAGPTSGAAAQPTFRALVAADLPAGVTGSQTANTFYAAPDGSAGTPSFRRIVPTDYEWGMIKKSVSSTESMTIPAGFQLTAHISFGISGASTISGELWIDQALATGTGILDFSFSGNSAELILL